MAVDLKQTVLAPAPPFSSALYWLPRLEATETLAPHLPRTLVVPYSHARLSAVMEGEGEYPNWSELVDQVTQASDLIGWPVFIRTDLASAKHSGPGSYLARAKADVPQVLSRTAEDNELKLWLSADQPGAFLIRQFLSLDAPFRAFAGLPVAREWRFYATSTDVLCAHPYWPEDAIKFRRGCIEPADWRERLRELHARPAENEWAQLVLLAQTAAAACEPGQAWSVDFAKDQNGSWWLIDMALMQQSWHWPDCPNAPQAPRKTRGTLKTT